MSEPKPAIPDSSSTDSLSAFCPACWTEAAFSLTACPHCGASISALSADVYSTKLVRALRHPISEIRERAARLLGNVGGPETRGELLRLVDQQADTYLAAAALEGLARLERRFPELPQTVWKSFTGQEYPLLVRVAALEALRAGGRR